MLLGDFRLKAEFSDHRPGVEELTQRLGELGIERGNARARAQPANRVEPVRVAVMKDRVGSFNDGLVVERNPDGRRIVGHAITEEPWRRNAGDSKWTRLDKDGGSDDRGIAAEIALPGGVAQLNRRRGSRFVVSRRERPAGKC